MTKNIKSKIQRKKEGYKFLEYEKSKHSNQNFKMRYCLKHIFINMVTLRISRKMKVKNKYIKTNIKKSKCSDIQRRNNNILKFVPSTLVHLHKQLKKKKKSIVENKTNKFL